MHSVYFIPKETKDALSCLDPREGPGLAYAHVVSRGCWPVPASLLTPNSSLTAGLPGTLDGVQKEMERGRKYSGVENRNSVLRLREKVGDTLHEYIGLKSHWAFGSF